MKFTSLLLQQIQIGLSTVGLLSAYNLWNNDKELLQTVTDIRTQFFQEKNDHRAHELENKISLALMVPWNY